MSAPHPPDPRRRYVPLSMRVAGVNAIVLIAAVIVTGLVLAPHKFGRLAEDEAAVLIVSLMLIAALNVLLLRRVVRPIEGLTALARRVDLLSPERFPASDSRSEAGELARTFNEMLERLETERREATGRVLAGQEAERLRIAQELHDQAGQELTAVLLGLSRLGRKLGPDEREQLDEVVEAVRGTLEDVRRIAIELRPEALDDLGVVSALAVLCDRFTRRTGIAVDQTLEETLPPLGPDAELVIYRVVQEALTNVARHSGADSARLVLSADEGRVSVLVEDTGSGIDQAATPGSGLRGMQERARLVGGTVTVAPGPQRGTRVCLTVAPEDVPAVR